MRDIGIKVKAKGRDTTTLFRLGITGLKNCAESVHIQKVNPTFVPRFRVQLAINPQTCKLVNWVRRMNKRLGSQPDKGSLLLAEFVFGDHDQSEASNLPFLFVAMLSGLAKFSQQLQPFISVSDAPCQQPHPLTLFPTLFQPCFAISRWLLPTQQFMQHIKPFQWRSQR